MSKENDIPVAVAVLLTLVVVFGPLAIGEVEQIPELKTIGISAFIGVMMALGGFAKSKEPFSPLKFVTTPIVGALAGVVMVLWGLSYADAVVWLANAGVTALVEIYGKAIVRSFWK